MSVVNSYISLKEHQANFPDRVGLHRPAGYNITSFREDIVRQLCGILKKDHPHCLAQQKGHS